MTKWWNNVVRKAPPPYYRNENKYDHLQISDIPGMMELFSSGKFPLHDKLSAFKNTTISAHKVKNNKYTPSISGRKNAIMFVSIYNFIEKKPKYAWQTGSLRNPSNPDVQTPDTRAIGLARGDKSFTLAEDEIGITIIFELDKQFIINIYYGEESEFDMYINRVQTGGTGDQDYDLNNGEVAALLILTQIVPEKGAYKERQRVFMEFGIGPLGRDTESKYIETLVSRGFVDLHENNRSASRRGYPIITPKGKAASNRFEMTHKKFYSDFKNEVKRDRDGEFTMFENSNPLGDSYQ